MRENIANKEHVQELSVQLIEDLKEDTLSLESLTLQETKQIKTADSLFLFLQQPLAKANLKRIQELVLSLDNIGLFYASTGGMSSIKNEMYLKKFDSSTQQPPSKKVG